MVTSTALSDGVQLGPFRANLSPRAVQRALRVIGLPARLALLVSPAVVRAARPAEIEMALQLEYGTFRALGYCDASALKHIDDYDKYLPQSRFFVARWHGRLVGVLRVIVDGPLPPPVRAEFEADPLGVGLGQAAVMEEVGIVAVHPIFINTQLGLQLYRAAWRDSKERGVTHYGAVMEDWLWKIVNERYHFTFEPFGTGRFYMGAVVYPLVMAFSDAERNMRRKDPALTDWFIEGLSGIAGVRQGV